MQREGRVTTQKMVGPSTSRSGASDDEQGAEVHDHTGATMSQ
jgi:hypothetical protein